MISRDLIHIIKICGFIKLEKLMLDFKFYLLKRVSSYQNSPF